MCIYLARFCAACKSLTISEHMSFTESHCCRLRELVHDCLSKHLERSAVFYADKLVTLSGSNPGDVYLLAQVRAGRNLLECVHGKVLTKLCVVLCWISCVALWFIYIYGLWCAHCGFSSHCGLEFGDVSKVMCVDG